MYNRISGIPQHCWRRRLDEPDPDTSIHTFSRPPAAEAISLLNVAARVGTYISTEREAGREPIFDLKGIDLRPPNPGKITFKRTSFKLKVNAQILRTLRRRSSWWLGRR